MIAVSLLALGVLSVPHAAYDESNVPAAMIFFGDARRGSVPTGVELSVVERPAQPRGLTSIELKHILSECKEMRIEDMPVRNPDGSSTPGESYVVTEFSCSGDWAGHEEVQSTMVFKAGSVSQLILQSGKYSQLPQKDGRING
ncbi:MAG: hypothetical protein ABW023_12265 [Sphingomonas sp.]